MSDVQPKTLSSAVEIMLGDNTIQFTREAWSELSGPTSVNRIYIESGKLMYCSWDGFTDRYRPSPEDVSTGDWVAVKAADKNIPSVTR